MKHLKKYTLFESNSTTDIISDVKDILLEIEDIGEIETYCSEFKLKKGAASEIKVWITPKEVDSDEVWTTFQINDTVVESFTRIIDYMEFSGWSVYQIIYDDGASNNEITMDDIGDWVIRNAELTLGEVLGITFRRSKNESSSKIPNGWVERNKTLVKDFKFESFREAQDFINGVADIAESQNHHPKIEWLYDKVQLSLSTHDASDTVTNKDIKLANSINSIYENN